MVCFEALKRKGEVWAKTSSLTFLLSKSFLKRPSTIFAGQEVQKMAKLSALLGSKGRSLWGVEPAASKGNAYHLTAAKRYPASAVSFLPFSIVDVLFVANTRISC
jgi:hypothetical protein